MFLQAPCFPPHRQSPRGAKGSELSGTTYADGGGLQIYFARLDATAARIGGELRLSTQGGGRIGGFEWRRLWHCLGKRR